MESTGKTWKQLNKWKIGDAREKEISQTKGRSPQTQTKENNARQHRIKPKQKRSRNQTQTSNASLRAKPRRQPMPPTKGTCKKGSMAAVVVHTFMIHLQCLYHIILHGRLSSNHDCTTMKWKKNAHRCCYCHFLFRGRLSSNRDTTR